MAERTYFFNPLCGSSDRLKGHRLGHVLRLKGESVEKEEESGLEEILAFFFCLRLEVMRDEGISEQVLLIDDSLNAGSRSHYVGNLRNMLAKISKLAFYSPAQGKRPIKALIERRKPSGVLNFGHMMSSQGLAKHKVVLQAYFTEIWHI